MIPCWSQVNPLLHVGLRFFRLCNQRLLRSLHFRSVHNGGDIMFRNLLALLIAGQPVATHRLTLLKPCHCLSKFTNTKSFNVLYFNKYDTRKGFLSAAEFPPWHGSKFHAIISVNINNFIKFLRTHKALTTGSAPRIRFGSRVRNNPVEYGIIIVA